MAEILIFTGLSLLFIHEMDAIRKKEWKMFIFLKDLDEETAYKIFTFLHIPLYLILFWGIFLTNQSINYWFSIVLNGFYIFHLFLHLLFRNHKSNKYKNWFSWFLIIGLAVIGILYFLLL